MGFDRYTPRFIGKVPRGRNWISKSVREEIYTRDNFTCQYCKKHIPRENLTIEHVIAVSQGGVDDPINYITVCRSCNSSKKDKPLLEFIKTRWNIQISELPIHGDVIMDCPELDKEYRKVRHSVYYKMRRDNLLKGSKALKLLEKMFRTELWETEYGKILAKRYSELPGQVRASVPLVEYIIPDTGIPAQKLLIEFCKSANTRAIVDSIVRILSNGEYNNPFGVIRSVLYSGIYDDATNKRIEQAFKRANLKKGDKSIYLLPEELKEVPIRERDLLQCRVEKEELGVGIANINNYEIRIPRCKVNEDIEVVIKKVTPSFAEAIRTDLLDISK